MEFIKRKMKLTTYETKLDMINDYKNGMKIKDISVKYDTPATTISGIIKRTEEIEGINDADLDRKKFRKAKFAEIEMACFEYIKMCRKSKIPLTRTQIREKAKELAASTGTSEFTASSGWLLKFLRRCNILNENNEEHDGTIATNIKTENDVNFGSDNICRLCAKPKQDIAIDVFSTKYSYLLEKLQTVFNVIIQPNDTYHKICLDCFTKLEVCHKFYEVVQQAQFVFNKRVYIINPEESFDPISQIKIEPEIDIQEGYEENSFETPENSSFSETFLNITPTKPTPKKSSHIESTSSGKTSIKKTTDEINNFYKFICVECRIDLKTYEKYSTHMTVIHGKDNPEITCCETKIPCIRLKLLEHFLMHVRPEELQCHECGKQFINKRTKQHHMKSHKRNIPCPHCDKMFYLEQYLRYHIYNVHTPDELKQKFECDVCQVKTTTKHAVLQHLIAKHKFEVDHPLAKPKEILCPHCAKSFTNSSTFDNHMRMKHNIKMITCPECGLEMNRKLLSGHMRRVHDTVQVTCPTCQKVCRNKMLLRTHIAHTHNAASYPCDICGSRIKTKIRLEEHRKGHFIENRFHCDVCSVKTNDFANILKHRKQAHPYAEPLPKGMARKIVDSTYEEKPSRS